MSTKRVSIGETPQAAVPSLTWVFSASVTVGSPVELGIVRSARRRSIAITGGSVHGPRLNGSVLAGGADWQDVSVDGVTELLAHYAIAADDGAVIEVVNAGLRVASVAVSERIARGESVEPDSYYFRTSPRFIVAQGCHDWLARSLFVASGVRRQESVEIDFYSVD